MEEQMIGCTECNTIPKELAGYALRTCRLCGALGCDACLNEAGYCTPCEAKLQYSKEEAIPV
jgi:hypothetical protein